MEEIWKDIPGYEDYYQASTLGRIRSVDREVSYLSGKNKVPRTDFWPSQIKTLRYRKDGYLQVNLSKNSKKSYFPVHKIIARVFLGEVPKKMDICHNNGDRSDNRVSNLRYDTRKNNLSDAISHGTRIQGEAHYNVKLTDDQVKEIIKDGRTQKIIASEYGVRQSHISRLKRRTQRRYLR